MINLLPPDYKHQLHASRANTLLLRYNIILLGALAFMGLAIGVTYVFLTSTQATSENIVRDNQNEVSGYATVQAQEAQFKANLATAKVILDKEVIYTQTILAISRLLPDGIVLQNLSLDVQTFGTQTTLSVQAKDILSAVRLKTSLEGSPLFSNVHFQSIQSTVDDTSDYPVTVSLNVTINKDAALRKVAAGSTTTPGSDQTVTPEVSP